MVARVGNITFDCDDVLKMAAFWSAVLGRPVDKGSSELFASIGGADGARREPAWYFNKVPESKRAKNRLHLDLVNPEPRAVSKLVALGATVTGKHQVAGGRQRWTVMQDPEGNEFCIAAKSFTGWTEPAAQGYPAIRQTVLDTTDPRALGEFYRQMFGLTYRAGDEPPEPGQPDPNGQDWLVLQDASGLPRLAFQKVRDLPGATWPDGPVPQQLHLDTTVPTAADLDAQHQRALALGARLLQDRSDDPEEPLRVYADPAGHPFCIFVG